jgi:hypothetical protein
MKLVFSETRSDYRRYLYPYVIWALPEAGERPADFFERGFLPGSPQLDRYYLCRNLRLPLAGWRPTSENRRILRKGAGWSVQLIPRPAFDFSPARRMAWKAFADERFGEDVMSFPRLDGLMAGPVISHLLHFTEPGTGRELGTALLFLDEPAVAYYYYAFYDRTQRDRNLGMFMMTRAVEFFAARGVAHLHLGTCYSERARYKTQFTGIEFFNGFRWSTDLAELKFMIRRDLEGLGNHLLDAPEYLAAFWDDSAAKLAAASSFKGVSS